MIHFDLVHNGLPGAIGVFLRLEPEPVVVDPGPSTSLDALREGLAARGVGVEDLRHVLLTHVHLDHAGATGHLARENPRLTVHVHVDGAPHMVDPTRLVASTRRTFGELHDTLWGEVLPIDAHRVRAWHPGDAPALRTIRPVPTPGHIDHHLAWLDETEGSLMAGDSLGIVLGGDVPTHPATPPPSVNLAAWPGTLDEILSIGPERVGVTHFGFHTDVPNRVEQMREGLEALTARVAGALDRDDLEDRDRYAEEVQDRLGQFADPERVARYFRCFSAGSDWDGVAFYLKRNPRPAGG